MSSHSNSTAPTSLGSASKPRRLGSLAVVLLAMLGLSVVLSVGVHDVAFMADLSRGM